MKFDPLFEALKEKIKIVDEVIFELIPEKEPKIIYDAARHYPLAGGKRIRPFIVLTSTEAVGGNPEKAVYAAAAVELLHNYSLVHDDIMDMDEKRRGRPTVHKVWGVNMAILAGDLLFSKVFEAVAKIPVEAEKVVKVLDVISKTSNELCEGQARDLEFENKETVTIDEYMKMISGKTGALIDASATIGGLIGTENNEYIQALSKYGRNVGIAFQIWDDVLDLIADEEKLGKPVGSDIRKGKKTIIVAHFLENASEEDKLKFFKVFGKYAGDVKGEGIIEEDIQEEVKKAIDLLKKYGSTDYAANLARKLIEEAKEALKALPESEARKHLELLADFIVEREY
ncbi:MULTISPECIES: polyprenyl synthetase family protein [Thermococcus]|uniref:Bifunctional short chain isoprenyl diphosphate synthase n=2 Tax=Thermococcus sibiricus TaxID=172049 RepID=C6A3U2_THESM|nr:MULTISPECIES: polyprenyl synthetase family protein [Thermococcus]KUK28606.1 MAG: Bifunctional short chain isoprenyl diphosphate synthase [Thermococcus sp. 40_45]HII67473.1 polyprenyl synthetase family protein [Thermococcaceae archaeon]ACS90287.1 Bifunctional short chain isoprenyl diphosphate synthase [Thermococcus sibiricus MM 739]KUK16790.1 MAG: Bifunctional short chain isoprenyl diphosphate synthase [Thermococcus sibiricus]MBC7095317.1 polyprenyl synthetase family protein [Thermococcus sp